MGVSNKNYTYTRNISVDGDIYVYLICNGTECLCLIPTLGEMIQFSMGNYFSYGGWMDVTINSTREKFDQNY